MAIFMKKYEKNSFFAEKKDIMMILKQLESEEIVSLNDAKDSIFCYVCFLDVFI